MESTPSSIAFPRECFHNVSPRKGVMVTTEEFDWIGFRLTIGVGGTNDKEKVGIALTMVVRIWSDKIRQLRNGSNISTILSTK